MNFLKNVKKTYRSIVPFFKLIFLYLQWKMKKLILHSLLVMLTLTVCFNMDVTDKRIVSRRTQEVQAGPSCFLTDGCRGRVIDHLRFVSTTSSLDISISDKKSPVLEKTLATYIFPEYEFCCLGFDNRTDLGIRYDDTHPLPEDDYVVSLHRIIV